MPKILGQTEVVGSLTATSVNGITGLNSNDGTIQPNGSVADAGISNYAARADHVHVGGIGGGASYLNDLLDVNISSVADGNVLLYDSDTTN